MSPVIAQRHCRIAGCRRRSTARPRRPVLDSVADHLSGEAAERPSLDCGRSSRQVPGTASDNPHAPPAPPPLPLMAPMPGARPPFRFEDLPQPRGGSGAESAERAFDSGHDRREISPVARGVAKQAPTVAARDLPAGNAHDPARKQFEQLDLSGCGKLRVRGRRRGRRDRWHSHGRGCGRGSTGRGRPGGAANERAADQRRHHDEEEDRRQGGNHRPPHDWRAPTGCSLASRHDAIEPDRLGDALEALAAARQKWDVEIGSGQRPTASVTSSSRHHLSADAGRDVPAEPT